MIMSSLALEIIHNFKPNAVETAWVDRHCSYFVSAYAAAEELLYVPAEEV